MKPVGRVRWRSMGTPGIEWVGPYRYKYIYTGRQGFNKCMEKRDRDSSGR